MQTPADGVPQALLRHLHLISACTSRFPSLPSLHVDRAVEYLTQAPRIVKGEAPMAWEYLNAPPDGKVYLAWQPERMGLSLATDGYQYVDSEQQLAMQVAAGYNLEIFIQHSGYRPQFENFTMHKRTRFRITGVHNPNVVGAPFDPSLWIIHYTQADPRHRFDASKIPLPSNAQRLWGERRAVESTMGHLERKEFMLEDRYNWPTVRLPNVPFTGNYPQQQQMYSGNPMAQMAAQRQREQYYQQRQGNMSGPSPAKRPRQSGPPQMAGAAPSILKNRVEQDPLMEEEEYATMEDALDFLTPREISRMRYKQHHEWMEEILNSPYTASQIVPIDLGLGLMGELGHLTEGLFDAPAKNAVELKDAPRYRKVQASEVEEFEKRVAKYLQDGKAEMETMREEHAARVAEIKQSRRLGGAERSLAAAEWAGSDVGNEPWRIEGRMGEADTGSGPKQTVEEIVKGVEESIGAPLTSTSDAVVCVQKGGLVEEDEELQDSTTLQSHTNAASDRPMADGDRDMLNPAAELLDQLGDSSNGVAQTAAAASEAQPLTESTMDTADDTGLQMASMQHHDDNNNTDSRAAGEGEPSEWVMVGRDTDSDINSNNTAQLQPAPPYGDTAGATLEEHMEMDEADESTTMFDAGEFGDFGDLDTAGEALEAYAGGNEDDGEEDGEEDLGLGLGLEESAFEEAFQGGGGGGGGGGGEGGGREGEGGEGE